LDPLDAHAGLMSLNVAALAALLDDRQNVTPDDWDLGSVIMRASDTIRAAIVGTLDCHRQLDEHKAGSSSNPKPGQGRRQADLHPGKSEP
jgi:hypothetical protein